MNADFERWVSLVDYLHDKMEVHMFHAKDLERLENPAMYRVLRECGIEIQEYANLCWLHRMFLVFNSLARKFSLKFLWRIGQIFRSLGQRSLKLKVQKYLDQINPDAIFITPYSKSTILDYEAIMHSHDWALKNCRWILSADHGSKIYFEKLKSTPILDNVNMYFASSDEAMKRTKGNDFIHPSINIGDLKHSAGFINRLKPYLRDIHIGKSIAIFLPSDISTNLKHRDFLLKLINRFRGDDRVESIIVKAHPNSSFTSFFECVPKDTNIKLVSTEYNSCEVCQKADLVISHPSSVLLEALSLNTPVYLVKSLEKSETLHSYLDLNLPGMNFDEWLSTENILDIPFSYNVDAFNRFAHNTSPKGENRELVYQFLINNCDQKPPYYSVDKK